MGWRSVIVTQHAKLSYTSHLMVVQTNDGINQIPIDDIELLLVSTTQAVITSCLLYTSPSPRDGATSRMPSSA